MDTYQFSFEKLEVWQLARILTADIYKHTVKFPNEEKYLLTSQLRRAAVSIAANIAEGYSKRGERDKMRFLNIAQGSLSECRYFLMLARDLKYAVVGKPERDLAEVSKLLNSYRRGIENNFNNSISPFPR